MSEIIIKIEKSELTKNSIIQLLEQLTIEYLNSNLDRKKIAVNFISSEEEFSLLEEIELLSTDIRGYANQIKVRGYVDNREKAIKQLQKMRIFDIQNISQFYFDNQINFPILKSYLRMLDYLRLLILEYLSLQN